MQSWANEYDDAASFETALDAARVPLGVVREVADTPQQDWAIEREAFVSIDVNGADCQIPRSPTRFSSHPSGPRSGSTLRGADNRRVLQNTLQMDEATIARLEASGVLQTETV